MTTTMPAIAPLRHGTVLAWVSFLGLVVGTVLIGTAYFLNAFTGDVADDGLAPIGAALYLVASVLWLTPSLVLAIVASANPANSAGRSGVALAGAFYAAIVGVVGGIAAVTATSPRIGDASPTALLLVLIAGILACAPLLGVMVRGALRRPA